MKVLFAVSNEAISSSIVKKYQQMYKEIISYKNVYYFNAILKELQKDKTYDRIVISEDLEPFANNNYETIDNFIFEKLDSISDEASNSQGEDIPIILIATDRRTKSESLLIKLFGIGVYSTLIGQDRSIEQVCNLIYKPRTKKEAKVYYQIDSNQVEYKPEEEVSEVEIQNILAHYKRLGRNEEKYVESFDSIASQYTDEQLRIIIGFLPLNVKAVLEERSPKYQQVMTFSGVKPRKGTTKRIEDMEKTKSKGRRKGGEVKLPDDGGIKVESIVDKAVTKKMTKPVVIPSGVSMTNVKKVENAKPKQEVSVQPSIIEEKNTPIVKEETLQTQQPAEQVVEEIATQVPPKRGRGRPRKIQPVEEQNREEIVQQEPVVKRKRGRPRKVQVEEETTQEQTVLPGLEPEENSILPGIEEPEEETTTMLPGMEEAEEATTTLPGFDEDEQEEEEQEEQKYSEYYPQETTLPGLEEEKIQEDTHHLEKNFYSENQPSSYLEEEEENYSNKAITNTQYTVNGNIENLLTQEKKIVSFVGTSKNGTSFLVNNMAQMLSEQGIRTAILDLTQNRNAYYIYTKNEEDLRTVAFECISRLAQGEAKGIKVNTNLDVYTSLPGEDAGVENEQTILSTLLKYYDLILLDCDFASPYGYIANSQEVYLVQSMDVLTIQPLTAYLRELKAKGVLEQEKLRIVVNKYTRVKGVTEKTIIGGMAYYNDPAMSYMTELFNRENVKYCIIPFELQTYAKYLEALVNCEISLKGYSKECISYFRKLANMVYPLVNNLDASNKKKKGKKDKPLFNQYEKNSNYRPQFSNQMNDTLNRMKKYE